MISCSTPASCWLVRRLKAKSKPHGYCWPSSRDPAGLDKRFAGAGGNIVMTVTPEFRAALAELYVDLAAEIAQAAPVCEVSGRCCRFKEYGHTLFLSRLEAELLLEAGLPPGAAVDDATCPFQIQGLCTARERRPLGCRIYFCDPRYAEAQPVLSERFISRLKSLHDEHGLAWEYRPLIHFLRELPPEPPTAKSPEASPALA